MEIFFSSYFYNIVSNICPCLSTLSTTGYFPIVIQPLEAQNLLDYEFTTKKKCFYFILWIMFFFFTVSCKWWLSRGMHGIEMSSNLDGVGRIFFCLWARSKLILDWWIFSWPSILSVDCFILDLDGFFFLRQERSLKVKEEGNISSKSWADTLISVIPSV